MLLFLHPRTAPQIVHFFFLLYQVPLEELRIQLSAHADTLRARLVEVVNEDYDEFVSLSTKLVDVDGAVASLQVPLAEIRVKVEGAKATVTAQASALQDGLRRRQAAGAARALLELGQDAVHVMSKIEKLLSEISESKTPPQQLDSDGILMGEEQHEALEARCRLLDRLCSEVSRLNFYAGRGQELVVVRQMTSRKDHAVNSLQSELDGALRMVLEAQNPSALGVLLHAYASLGRPEAAEKVVRYAVVAPIVSKSIAAVQDVPRNANGQKIQSASDPEPTLGAVLPTIGAALRQEAGPFLELAMSPFGGAHAFDFLGGAVLPEVLKGVDAAYPGAYSPGFPDAFHGNYMAATSFLEDMEKFCVSLAQIERFRASTAYTELQKKWNVAVYFSLRFQDVAGVLEEVLATTALTPCTTQKSPFVYAATAATWDALLSAVDPGIFLPPLSDRFLRLVLQVVARFCSWVTEGASIALPDNAENNLNQQQQQQSQQLEELSVKGESQEEAKPWGAESTAEQLLALWCDVAALQTGVQTELQAALMDVMGSFKSSSSSGFGMGEAIAAALDDCGNNLTSAGDVLMRAAASGLVERCCEALKQLRGIVATFRMTTRMAPTRPAQYASTILAPLRSFLSEDRIKSLDAVGRADLARAVVDGVALRYHKVASDTLSTVRKTESSLRRLKSRKGAGPAGEGEASVASSAVPDTDKMIELQLALDVAEFKSKAAECDVATDGLNSLRDLSAAVAPVETERQVEGSAVGGR